MFLCKLCTKRDVYKRQGERRHDRKKAGRRDRKLRIEEQVLWIADRRGHAAKIGCDGLKRDDPNEVFGAVDHREHQDSKGDEGDERYVVGDEHRREKWKRHQHERKHPEPFASGEKFLCEDNEKSTFLEPRNHFHQAKEQAENPQVYVSHVLWLGRYKPH